MLKVLSITVVVGGGTDKVYLHLDATPSTWPWDSPASARIDCAADTADTWLADNHLDNLPIKRVKI